MTSETRSFITVANCYDLQQANRMKLVLDAAGIPAFIPDEVTAGLAPFHFMTGSGVRVQVTEDRAEEARRIIEEIRAE